MRELCIFFHWTRKLSVLITAHFCLTFYNFKRNYWPYRYSNILLKTSMSVTKSIILSASFRTYWVLYTEQYSVSFIETVFSNYYTVGFNFFYYSIRFIWWMVENGRYNLMSQTFTLTAVLSHLYNKELKKKSFSAFKSWVLLMLYQVFRVSWIWIQFSSSSMQSFHLLTVEFELPCLL